MEAGSDTLPRTEGETGGVVAGMCGLTLLVLSVSESVLCFPEDTQMGGKVVHQASGEVRLPVHLFGPLSVKNTGIMQNVTTLIKHATSRRTKVLLVPCRKLDEGVLQRLSDLQ